jgi:Zn finger protein HypA/HybF involved in hydrogenase expression
METWLDGNAMGGPMRDLFSVDVTGAMTKCANCGMVGALAQTRLFEHAPGMVARCPNCDSVMMRMVRGPGRAWLDLQGMSYLQLPMPDET